MDDVRKARSARAADAHPRGSYLAAIGMGLLVVVAGTGCATKGDFRALEERVLDQSRHQKSQPDPFERIAALAAEVESLRQGQQRLAGDLEVARKTADDALAEARKARQANASSGAEVTAAGAAAAADLGGTADDTANSKELAGYQKALRAWRSDEQEACIDLFRAFLQNYPSSPYADDAAYWMADCYFKQGDYRVAVLRFNDVVRVYPTGNKAADALYRQGESLLKLGPGFHDAARTVFRQVLKEYPDSDRAREAKQQLDAIGVG